MQVKKLKQYLVLDESQNDYTTYVPAQGIVIRVKSDRDDRWYTATLIQEIHDDQGNDIVIGLEGLPEDPYNHKVESTFDETDIEAQVYMLWS